MSVYDRTSFFRFFRIGDDGNNHNHVMVHHNHIFVLHFTFRFFLPCFFCYLLLASSILFVHSEYIFSLTMTMWLLMLFQSIFIITVRRALYMRFVHYTQLAECSIEVQFCAKRNVNKVDHSSQDTHLPQRTLTSGCHAQCVLACVFFTTLSFYMVPCRAHC